MHILTSLFNFPELVLATSSDVHKTITDKKSILH
ncbi:MAG: hypothetical protein ACI81A_001330, partial [Paraglaciecola sp.]